MSTPVFPKVDFLISRNPLKKLGEGWFSFTWNIWLCSFGCLRCTSLFRCLLLQKCPPLQNIMLEKAAFPTFWSRSKVLKRLFLRFPRVWRAWSRTSLGPPQLFWTGDATDLKGSKQFPWNGPEMIGMSESTLGSSISFGLTKYLEKSRIGGDVFKKNVVKYLEKNSLNAIYKLCIKRGDR